MKKKQLVKRIWQSLILLTLVLLLGSVAGLLWSYNAPLEVTEEYPAYSYRQEAVVDYRVHLLPNSFFSEPVLESGRGYITELTDYIATDFSYYLSGSSDAKVSGEYSVIATLTAYAGRDGHKVFEKTSELLPPQSFTATSNNVSIQDKVNIPFQEYLKFSNRLREETRFNPDELSLTVKYNISVTAETEHGVIRDKLSPILEIPLKGNTFVVTGDLTENKNDSILTYRKESVPFVEQARKAFSLITIALSVALLYFMFLTTPKEQAISQQEREASLILKKHRERIAVTTSSVTEVSGKVVQTKSFEDIVKIADELGKPILYHKVKSEAACRHSFIVLSQECDYIYYAGLIMNAAP